MFGGLLLRAGGALSLAAELLIAASTGSLAATQGGVPPGRADYLPDSRTLTPADELEREALLKAFGANLRHACRDDSARNSLPDRISPT
ncbi:MAG TPA: hypothetical protein VK680_04855 [Solirubrobacteraceae bacterium]|jgi:hypothetical protein|nr:hypothetical protein [Solirubrobacteraceae bacterium]